MLRFSANKAVLRCVQAEVLTSGSRKIYHCQFDFNNAWDGLDRTAIFRAGGVTRDWPLDDQGTCVVPWEVLERPGPILEVGIKGTDGSGVVLRTVWAPAGRIMAGSKGGQGAQIVPTDTYGEILRRANEAVETAQSVREDANNGVFDGEDAHFPDGGKTGQVLAKASDKDGDVEWVSQTGGEASGPSGYYTPIVTQPSDGEMVITYSPSTPDMPEVETATVSLPAGKDGAQGPQGIQGPAGNDGHTPEKGVDYWTPADKQEIVEEVTAAAPNGNTVYVTIDLAEGGEYGTSSHSSGEIMTLVQSGVDVRCIYDEFVLLPLYIASEELVMLGAFLPGSFFNLNGRSLREDLIYLAGYMIIGDTAQYIEIPYEYPMATSENMGVVRADPAEAADTQPVRIGEDGMLYTAAGAADTEQIGWQHITTITAESADIISYEITAEEYPFLAECNEIVVVFKKAENTSTPYIKFSANDSKNIQNSAGNMGYCTMRASLKGRMVRLGMSGFSNISMAPTMNNIGIHISSIAYNYVDRLTSYDHFEKIKVESYTKFIDIGGTIAFYGWKA